MKIFNKIRIRVGDTREQITAHFLADALKQGYAESEVLTVTDQALVISDYNTFLNFLFAHVKNTTDTHLQVWWSPQLGSKAITPFVMPVHSFNEAKLIYNTLANYDLYQHENAIKPDYSNMGGLQYWDEGYQAWKEYTDEDGYSFSEVLMNQD